MQEPEPCPYCKVREAEISLLRTALAGQRGIYKELNAALIRGERAVSVALEAIQEGMMRNQDLHSVTAPKQIQQVLARVNWKPKR